jgi:hypothetical protein
MEKIYKKKYGETHRYWDKAFSLKADICMKLLTAGSALYMGREHGEDSAGRAKGRSCTAKETVDFAVEMTEHLFSSFAEREWLLGNPLPEELLDEGEGKD